MIEVKNFVACPEVLPLVARQVFNEWFVSTPGFSEEVMLERMRGGKEKELPIGLVAFIDGEPAGTVSLLDRDLKEPATVGPWLAGLLVFPEFREKGVGSALVRAVEQNAAAVGEREVYLVTGIPQYYEKMGWEVKGSSALDEECVVMRRGL
jgi:predicted N-acetyltransferase YhbS